MLNRVLGADFDAFSYIPMWDARMHAMDLPLRAEAPQRVRIPGAGVDIELAAGEEIRVEICTKFRPVDLRAELSAAGFTVGRILIDAAGDYALTLAFR